MFGCSSMFKVCTTSYYMKEWKGCNKPSNPRSMQPGQLFWSSSSLRAQRRRRSTREQRKRYRDYLSRATSTYNCVLLVSSQSSSKRCAFLQLVGMVQGSTHDQPRILDLFGLNPHFKYLEICLSGISRKPYIDFGLAPCRQLTKRANPMSLIQPLLTAQAVFLVTSLRNGLLPLPYLVSMRPVKSLLGHHHGPKNAALYL